jgi:hypothetical protein
MKRNFESMSADELWAFHEEISLALSEKLTDRKTELERRFRLIRPLGEPNGARRPYPPV